MNKFRCVVGLGRLVQFPETLIVEASTPDKAASIAHAKYRSLITDKLTGTPDQGMLNKIVCFEALEIIKKAD